MCACVNFAGRVRKKAQISNEIIQLPALSKSDERSTRHIVIIGPRREGCIQFSLGFYVNGRLLNACSCSFFFLVSSFFFLVLSPGVVL